MERIDQLINKICSYIEKRIEKDDLESGKDISEATKALAELVSARACLQRFQKLHKTQISHIEIVDGVVCIPIRHPYERTFHYEPLIDHL